MKILIDHYYKTIYNGEFREWVELNIINPLKSVYEDIKITNNEDETLKYLNSEEFDIIITTGYSSNTLGNVQIKKVKKTIGIIYDNNAEKLLELFDSSYISDIISNKSRIIFLCNAIITPQQIIKDEIIKLYAGYKEVFDINKIYNLSFFLPNLENNNPNKIIKNIKYVVIDSSINGATFLLDDIQRIIKDINIEDIPDNFKFVLIADNLTSNIWNNIKDNGLKDYFMIYKDITDEELESLYKYSICNIFPSSLDTNISKIIKAIKLNSICLLNSLNDIYVDYFNDSISYYSEEDNILSIIKDIMRSNKTTKDIIKNNQTKHFTNKSNDKTILDVVNTLFTK